MGFLRYREDTIHDEIRRRIYNALNKEKGGTLGPYSVPSPRKTQELRDFLELEKRVTQNPTTEAELKPVIETPVRYDHVTECLIDTKGEIVALTIDRTDDGVKELGQYIANAINDHSQQAAEIERLRGVMQSVINEYGDSGWAKTAMCVRLRQALEGEQHAD